MNSALHGLSSLSLLALLLVLDPAAAFSPKVPVQPSFRESLRPSICATVRHPVSLAKFSHQERQATKLAGAAGAENVAEVSTSAPTAEQALSVCVVGGGPVGLAAALRVLSIDWVKSVTVVEKRPLGEFDDGPGTYGISLAPRGADVLQNLPGKALEWIQQEGQPMPGTYAVRANRPILREGIFRAMMETFGGDDAQGQNGRVHLEFGQTVEQVDMDAKRVTLSDGKTVDYDLLVLADGIHSPTAKLIGNPDLVCRKRASWRVIKTLRVPALKRDNRAMFTMTAGDPSSLKAAYQEGEIAAWVAPIKGEQLDTLLLFFDRELGLNPWKVTSGKELRERMVSELRLTDVSKKSCAVGDAEAMEWLSALDESMLDDFAKAKPHYFWSGKCDAVADAKAGIVLAGDAAGGMLGGMLGQGVQRGFEDAADIGRMLEWAAGEEKGASGGGEWRKRVVQRAAGRYAEEVQAERSAVRDMSLMSAMTWKLFGREIGDLLPDGFLQRVSDPQVRYRDVLRERKRLRPLIWLAYLQWWLLSVPEDEVR